MKRLRDVLARVVMMGVAITQNGCCCPETDTHVDVDFDRSSPAISALIDRCLADSADCEELCRAALDEELGEDAMFYEVLECDVSPLPDGAHVFARYWDGSACGRAPEGLARATVASTNPITRWLARAAHLEAASVVAFTHLAADLYRHGAPRELIAAALVAARDEVRHAAVLRGLVAREIARSSGASSHERAGAVAHERAIALAQGALAHERAGALAHEAAMDSVPIVRVAPYRRASLRELAMLNAIEGCARETIGAAINLWQAQCARDPEVREAFASIARDEVAHAELARAIHAWASTQLDAQDIAAIDTARLAALVEIANAPVVDPDTRLVLGLPDAQETRAMIDALAHA